MQNLKYGTNEPVYKTETDSQYIEKKFMVTKWKVGGGINEEYGTNRYSSVQFSRSVMSDSLPPHESQHTRPPCPSPTPGVHSDSHPSSQ